MQRNELVALFKQNVAPVCVYEDGRRLYAHCETSTTLCLANTGRRHNYPKKGVQPATDGRATRATNNVQDYRIHVRSRTQRRRKTPKWSRRMHTVTTHVKMSEWSEEKKGSTKSLMFGMKAWSTLTADKFWIQRLRSRSRQTWFFFE